MTEDERVGEAFPWAGGDRLGCEAGSGWRKPGGEDTVGNLSQGQACDKVCPGGS